MRRSLVGVTVAALACGGSGGVIRQGDVIPAASEDFGAVRDGPGLPLTVALDTLGAELARALRLSPSLRIAIAEFPDLRGAVSDFSRFVSERLSTLLARNTSISVVERRRLDAVLAEVDFGQSGLVDPDQARQLGRLLGADAIVIGTVSDMADHVEIDGRVVEIESGALLPGAHVVVRKDANVVQLLRRGRRFPGGS